MDDKQLRHEVTDELEFEPSIDAAHIGVAARNRVVTLSGHVSNYAEKLAAEAATRRIRGVRAVASEIEVRCPGEAKTADDEIAKRAGEINRGSDMVLSKQSRRGSDSQAERGYWRCQ